MNSSQSLEANDCKSANYSFQATNYKAFSIYDFKDSREIYLEA